MAKAKTNTELVGRHDDVIYDLVLTSPDGIERKVEVTSSPNPETAARHIETTYGDSVKSFSRRAEAPPLKTLAAIHGRGEMAGPDIFPENPPGRGIPSSAEFAKQQREQQPPVTPKSGE